MIRSMTGFGKARCQLNERTINIEVKSLNSKSLDFSIKMPQIFRDKEQAIKNLAGQALLRGKIDIFIAVETIGENPDIAINKPLFAKYYNELKELASKLEAPFPGDIFSAITRFPEVLKQELQQTNEESWVYIEQSLRQALLQVDDFRRSEGAHLLGDLMGRIGEIRNLLEKTGNFEAKRIETLKNRLIKNLNELKEAGQADPNRFEQELIYYLEKLDITEEKVRLTKHLDYFADTVMEDDSPGRKLGFIAQEIGREINTIGSKANDADIQKLVVQMKDELEKVKEQLLNIL